MSTTTMRQLIRAPRSVVYRALIDGAAVKQWMVPDGMRSEVHRFEAREGGAFRISLTYEGQEAKGKSGARTDTYQGHFVTLVPGRQVIETMEFETSDPAMQGEMRVSYRLVDAPGGTELHAVHENVPPGVAPADNELGWRLSLAKLAAFVEKDGA